MERPISIVLEYAYGKNDVSMPKLRSSLEAPFVKCTCNVQFSVPQGELLKIDGATMSVSSLFYGDK